MTKEEEITFTEKEHKGNQHFTFQEGCYDCKRESRLIRAKRTVDLGTSLHQYKVEDMNISPNPLR